MTQLGRDTSVMTLHCPAERERSIVVVFETHLFIDLRVAIRAALHCTTLWSFRLIGSIRQRTLVT